MCLNEPKAVDSSITCYKVVELYQGKYFPIYDAAGTSKDAQTGWEIGKTYNADCLDWASERYSACYHGMTSRSEIGLCIADFARFFTMKHYRVVKVVLTGECFEEDTNDETKFPQSEVAGTIMTIIEEVPWLLEV